MQIHLTTPRSLKYIILFTFLSFLLFSCKKKYCWNCRTQDYYSYEPMITTSSDSMICDKTKEEIRSQESYTVDTMYLSWGTMYHVTQTWCDQQ